MKTMLAFASGVAGVHYTPRPAGSRSLCGDLHSGGGAWSDFHVLSSWWESGEGTPSAEFFIARERDLNSRSKQTNRMWGEKVFVYFALGRRQLFWSPLRVIQSLGLDIIATRVHSWRLEVFSHCPRSREGIRDDTKVSESVQKTPSGDVPKASS